MSTRSPRIQVRKMSEQAYTNGSKAASSNVISYFAIGVSIVVAFWSVANPRDDIKSMRIEAQEQLRQVKGDFQADLNNITKDMKLLLTKDEHREFVLRTDKDIARIDAQTNDLRNRQVSREEHIQHWGEIDDKHNSLRQQVYELRKDFVGTYTVGDQIKNIQKQIDDIRGKKAVPPP
jgi:hypothetical protein